MKLVIVEDDPILLQSLRLLLSGEKGIEIVGAFSTAEKAIETLADLAPDTMLVDLGLPDISGIELIRQVKAMYPEIDVMVHTVYEDRESVFAALKAGASAYILKGSTPRELIESLFSLHGGGSPMSPKIARKVILEFQAADTGDQYLLSHREKEILVGIEKGLTYKELAERLFISPHTVHTHIKKIYEKLHAKDRSEALSKARKKGIL